MVTHSKVASCDPHSSFYWVFNIQVVIHTTASWHLYILTFDPLWWSHCLFSPLCVPVYCSYLGVVCFGCWTVPCSRRPHLNKGVCRRTHVCGCNVCTTCYACVHLGVCAVCVLACFIVFDVNTLLYWNSMFLWACTILYLLEPVCETSFPLVFCLSGL